MKNNVVIRTIIMALSNGELSKDELFDLCEANYPYAKPLLEMTLKKLIKSGQVIEFNGKYKLFDDNESYVDLLKSNINDLIDNYSDYIKSNKVKVKDKKELNNIINSLKEIVKES